MPTATVKILSRSRDTRAAPLALINAAYLYLLELIDQGVEYPDAEWKAASKFDVPSSAIREMYDGEAA